MYRGLVSDDGNFLIVKERDAKDSNIYIADISKGVLRQLSFKPLIQGFIGDHNFVHNVGNTLYFKTNYKADRGRIVMMNLDNSSPENWKTLV